MDGTKKKKKKNPQKLYNTIQYNTCRFYML